MDALEIGGTAAAELDDGHDHARRRRSAEHDDFLIKHAWVSTKQNTHYSLSVCMHFVGEFYVLQIY